MYLRQLVDALKHCWEGWRYGGNFTQN